MFKSLRAVLFTMAVGVALVQGTPDAPLLANSLTHNRTAYLVRHQDDCQTGASGLHAFETKHDVEEYLSTLVPPCGARAFRLFGVDADRPTHRRAADRLVLKLSSREGYPSEWRLADELHSSEWGRFGAIEVFEAVALETRVVVLDGQGDKLPPALANRLTCAEICAPLWEASGIGSFPLGKNICAGDACICFGLAKPVRGESSCSRRRVLLVDEERRSVSD